MKIITGSILILASALASIGAAQESKPPAFLNLDPSDVLSKGATEGSFDLRVFGGHENLTYASLSHRWGMSHRLEGVVRGVIAGEKTAPAGNGGLIRFGGVDFEAAVRYLLSESGNVVGLVGVGTPYGPAQKSPIMTLGLSTTRKLSEDLTFEINPRATLNNGNAIIGLGLGARTSTKNRYGFSLEYTPILSGDNTRDIVTGATTKRDLYGVAMHYGLVGGNVVLAVGYTNATGGTTGFGLTPGLGGSGAFYLSIRGRY